MDIQIVSLDSIPIVMIQHRGPYEEVGAVFEQLWSWVTAQSVPVQRTIGIYWDNPDYVAQSQLRSAACVEVPSSFQLYDRSGLPLEMSSIAPGQYATTRFVGPYEDLAPVWSNLTRHVEGTLRRQISDNPAFEVYVNDPSDTSPQDLITELYLPVI